MNTITKPTKESPLPWKTVGKRILGINDAEDGCVVAAYSTHSPEDFAFMVTACNNHARLVEALLAICNMQKAEQDGISISMRPLHNKALALIQEINPSQS